MTFPKTASAAEDARRLAAATAALLLAAALPAFDASAQAFPARPMA